MNPCHPVLKKWAAMEEKKEVKITNIGAVARLSSQLELQDIYENYYYNFNKKVYNPLKFSGLIIKLETTGVTALLFKTGSICLSGAKSVEIMTDSLLDLIHALKTVGRYDADLLEFRITNICGSMRLPCGVDLIKLADHYRRECSYEPEIFPGAKFTSDGIIYTVHHTGSLFATGFKDEEIMEKAFNNVKNKLLLFKK